MKKIALIMTCLILVLLLCSCATPEKKEPTQYKSWGKLTGTLTYECPRCHTVTLQVESGKSYGICTSCDEKYFIK